MKVSRRQADLIFLSQSTIGFIGALGFLYAYAILLSRFVLPVVMTLPTANQVFLSVALAASILFVVSLPIRFRPIRSLQIKESK